MHEPPVVRFCGHLKYMRFSDFDDVQRMLLDFCFPGFRGAHKPNSAPAELSSNELGLDGLTIMPGNWRRYAPSILFPRSRYFSVVRDPDREDDGGTLACELRTYRDPLRAGHLDVFDLSADGRYRMGVVPHDDGIAFWSQAGFEGYISITICDPVRLRTQLAEKWKMIEEHTRSQGANYQGLILQEPYPILNIPFKTDHFSIDGIIDLRYVDARAWYVDVFGRETMRFFNSDVPTDFCEMLDFLIDPHIGGNPFTMFIGKKLTEYGIQGLVYPSTRTDFTVVFENDKLRDFSGWNFIALRPPFADIQRVNLESLPEGRHILLDSELDIDAMKSLGWMPQHDCSDRRPERKDLSYLQREDSGNFEGSLRCTGLEEAREKEYFRSMVEGQSPWTRLKRIDETQKKFCAQGN